MWWELNILSKFQIPSFYGFEDFEENYDWVNELIN